MCSCSSLPCAAAPWLLSVRSQAVPGPRTEPGGRTALAGSSAASDRHLHFVSEPPSLAPGRGAFADYRRGFPDRDGTDPPFGVLLPSLFRSRAAPLPRAPARCATLPVTEVEKGLVRHSYSYYDISKYELFVKPVLPSVEQPVAA